jgi:hypothetical protein
VWVKDIYRFFLLRHDYLHKKLRLFDEVHTFLAVVL